MFLSKHKNGTYHIYYRSENGKRTKVSTKTNFKKEALKFLSEFESEYKVKRELKTRTISLASFRFEFLKYSEINHAETTHKYVKIMFKQFLEYCGNISVAEITPKLAEGYIQHKTKTSIQTAQKQLAHLRKAFNDALRHNYIASNPF